MMKKFDEITVEELDDLIAEQKKSITYSNINEDTFEALKPQLISYYKYLRGFGFMDGDNLLNYKYTPSICACMGPTPGFALCPCSVRMHMESYRFYLAKHLIIVEG